VAVPPEPVPKAMQQECVLILARLLRPFDYVRSHAYYTRALQRFFVSPSLDEV
jgi:hypothetical protein